MALPTFDSVNGIVAPDYVVPVEQAFTVDTGIAEDGTRWAELIDANDKITFSLTFQGLNTVEATALIAFHRWRQGPLLSFAWKPPFLDFTTEAYGFASAFSWRRSGMDEYDLSVSLERRPIENGAV